MPADAAAVDPLAAYRGLATWVDIYDSAPYDRPVAAARRMNRNGVETLFLETANYRIERKVHRPRAVSSLVEAAHAHGIEVVAWYLPSLARLKVDFRRALAAVRFETQSGERFDSFALDVEATVVRDITTRNRRARALAHRIRGAVGPTYAMGAIVPEAGALYWPDFPYRAIDRHFDVFLPMAYFTYRTSGYRGVYRFVRRNVAAVGRETGDSTAPVHVIGGVAEDATSRETRAYVDAVADGGAIGGSIYDFTTTRGAQWEHLRRVPQ